MTKDYILDSYAWVEYLIGSDKGKIVNELFKDDKNNFFTLECSLAELNGWAIKNNKDFKKIYGIIISNSKLLPITRKDWIIAAKERFLQRKTQKDFGLIDSLILSKQKEMGCKLITGDKHFKNLKNVVFLK